MSPRYDADAGRLWRLATGCLTMFPDELGDDGYVRLGSQTYQVNAGDIVVTTGRRGLYDGYHNGYRARHTYVEVFAGHCGLAWVYDKFFGRPDVLVEL